MSISTEGGWTLSAFTDGLVVFENVGTDNAPRHPRNVEPETVLAMRTTLAMGKAEEVEALDWLAGWWRETMTRRYRMLPSENRVRAHWDSSEQDCSR